MQIQWNKNPLRSVVELDDHDKEILRLKLIIEQYEYRIVGAYCSLSGKFRPADMQEALSDLDYPHIAGDERFNERIDELMHWMLEELKGTHVGDCTCVPCSCMKCHAEYLLSIDTIKDLGKHAAYKVGSACDTSETLEQAIAQLENYEPVMGKEWSDRAAFDQYVPRWKQEAKVAAEWLRTYRDEHFPLEAKRE